MNQINPIAKVVLELLLTDGVQAAEAYVNENLIPEKDRAEAAARAAIDNVTKARNLIDLARSEVGVAAPAVAVLRVPEAKDSDQNADEKRALILSAADDLVLDVGDVVTTDEVIAYLKRKNVVLPGVRPGTSVGNVLHKALGWERVAEGKFKKVAGAA